MVLKAYVQGRDDARNFLSSSIREKTAIHNHELANRLGFKLLELDPDKSIQRAETSSNLRLYSNPTSSEKGGFSPDYMSPTKD